MGTVLRRAVDRPGRRRGLLEEREASLDHHFEILLGCRVLVVEVELLGALGAGQSGHRVNRVLLELGRCRRRFFGQRKMLLSVEAVGLVLQVGVKHLAVGAGLLGDDC